MPRSQSDGSAYALKHAVSTEGEATTLKPDARFAMRRRGRGLTAAIAGSTTISTDVFDTLLLRTHRSERWRIAEGERRFAALLADQGIPIAADVLIDARLQAQRLAFRVRAVGERPGEVRLLDIVTRQVATLGLPSGSIAVRMRIEVEVEKRCLSPNRILISALQNQRDLGSRILAISDTTLPTEAVEELIVHFCGADFIDRVFTSSDMQATKRHGQLFYDVASAEDLVLGDMIHLGDDWHADILLPRAVGLKAHHMPRARWRTARRHIDGALAETRRHIARRVALPPKAIAINDAVAEQFAFGERVFGPIVAELAIFIWLYMAEAERSGRPILLFCARGGLLMREAFEQVVSRLGLPVRLPRANLAISRLVAVRGAVLRRSRSAIEELDREFQGQTHIDVAAALTGREHGLDGSWSAPFEATAFMRLLYSTGGERVLEDIRDQNNLFVSYVEGLLGDADRVILCDTGLYGSTQRLLEASLPHIRWETVQAARCNYKGFSESHFPRVTGLIVERDGYSPLDPRSAMLRYWQLIESLFEPSLQSVRTFRRDNTGQIVANCGPLSPDGVIVQSTNPLWLGATASLAQLVPGDGAKVLTRAIPAWRRLHRAITRPTVDDTRVLDVGTRSVDFGRAQTVPVISTTLASSLIARMRTVRAQLWREGAVSRYFPLSRHLMLPAIEATFMFRSAVRVVRRARSRRRATMSVTPTEYSAPHAIHSSVAGIGT